MSPGRVFAEHPTLFALCVGAAALAALAFTGRAVRGHGLRRLGWGLLALGEAGQVAGMVRARDRARTVDWNPAWG